MGNAGITTFSNHPSPSHQSEPDLGGIVHVSDQDDDCDASELTSASVAAGTRVSYERTDSTGYSSTANCSMSSAAVHSHSHSHSAASSLPVLDQLLKEIRLLRRDMDSIKASLSKQDQLEQRVQVLEKSASQLLLPEGGVHHHPVVQEEEAVENKAPPLPPTRHIFRLSSRPMAVCSVSKKSL